MCNSVNTTDPMWHFFCYITTKIHLMDIVMMQLCHLIQKWEKRTLFLQNTVIGNDGICIAHKKRPCLKNCIYDANNTSYYFRERHILLTLFYVNESSRGLLFFTIPYLGLFCQCKNTRAITMLIKSIKNGPKLCHLMAYRTQTLLFISQPWPNTPYKRIIQA